jgi:hypothetical protein
LQVVDLLVDLTGIEPVTSSMPWKRAPSCATGPLRRKDSLFSRMRVGKSNLGCGTKPGGMVSKVVRVSEHSAAGGAVLYWARNAFSGSMCDAGIGRGSWTESVV